MSNGLLFTREGGYKYKMLQFTRDIVNYLLKAYGRPQTKPGPQAAGLLQALQGVMVTNSMRFVKLNLFIIKTGGKKHQNFKYCISHTINTREKYKVHLHNKCWEDHHRLND